MHIKELLGKNNGLNIKSVQKNRLLSLLFHIMPHTGMS